MTVRSTKASTPPSLSKTATKAVEDAATPTKAAANEAGKALRKSSAATGKAAKKGIAIAAHSTKANGRRSRPEAAAKAVELAAIPPKTVANEAMKVIDDTLDGAVAVSGAVVKEAATRVSPVTASRTDSRSNIAAKVVEIASIPPKAVVNEADKLAGEALAVIASTAEAVKTDSVYAIDIYKGSATEMLDSTEDIAKAASEVVTSVTEMHETIWSSMQRMVQAAVEMPVQFAACTNFADLVETQRAVMRQGFSEWLNFSQEILMANRRITDRAISALELR